MADLSDVSSCQAVVNDEAAAERRGSDGALHQPVQAQVEHHAQGREEYAVADRDTVGNIRWYAVAWNKDVGNNNKTMYLPTYFGGRKYVFDLLQFWR